MDTIGKGCCYEKCQVLRQPRNKTDFVSKPGNQLMKALEYKPDGQAGAWLGRNELCEDQHAF